MSFVMFEKRSDYFERNGAFGQVDYPFRISSKNRIRAAFELIAKAMLAIITFGALPLALLLFGVNLVPSNWQNVYALVVGSFVVASVPLAWSFKDEAIYNSEKEAFEMRVSLLGRTFRSWVWPKTLFMGITYGHKGLTRGRVSVVRLKCKIDGYLVDSFFQAKHKIEAEEMAQRLSKISGLPVLGEEYTGGQHELNDLRRHAWLTAKYGGGSP